MATVNPLSVAPAVQQSQDDKKPSNDVFGKDAFMKLLVEQLRHQSPTDASDGQQWINQMTQFSMLEQLQQQSAAQTKSDAAAYLGKTVSYLTKAGVSGEGQVEKVDLSGATPTLTVAGHAGITTVEVIEVR
jgi:flagellar basal-body rod modification protein FlgD